MALQDYIPNIFGVTDPGVEGLLGADQSKSLQSRSNIAGLLGAAAALSQGMSRSGPRRSALQNILGAAAGGYGAAGQQYQQGLQTVGQQQQLAQQMRERERAEMTRQAIERVIQSPEVASNPALVAYFRSNPDKALERQMQMQMAQQARQGTQPIAQQPAPQDSGPIGAASQAGQNLQGEKPLPEVPVTGLKSQYEKAITEAENAADFYSRAGGKENLDISKQYQSEADRYRGLLRQEGLLEGVESALSKVDPTLRDRADAVINNAPGLTPEQLQTETRAILTDDANLKQQFDPRVVSQKLKIAEAGSARQTVNVGDKVLAGERAKSQAKAEDAAMSAQNAASDVAAIIDVLKPYRGGALQDFVGSIGAYFPGTKLEELATARQAAEAIRAKLAPTLRVEGSGATSDFEIKSFLSAIPSLFNTAEGRELMATYTQRLADRSAAAADIRARLTEENKFSLKNFREALRAEGLDRVFTDEDLVRLRGGTSSNAPGSTLPPEVKKRYRLQ